MGVLWAEFGGKPIHYSQLGGLLCRFDFEVSCVADKRTLPEPPVHLMGNPSEPNRLRDLDLKNSYSSSFSDLLEDFYLPVLDVANQYRRAAGYFSSAILSAIEIALTGYLDRGGKIQIICSPRMTEEDASAISDGFADRQIASMLETQISDLDFQMGSNAPSSIVRSLIKRGALDLRIAVNVTGAGIYHDKYGIFTDRDNDSVAFDGSINETLSGWSAYGNHESFQLFKSWDDRVEDRVAELSDRFDRTWSGHSKRLRIVHPDRLSEVFEPRREDIPEDEALRRFRNARRFRVGERRRSQGQSAPARELQDHQKDALSNWKKQAFRGIISFVTGGGKTITALAAAREWLEDGNPVVVLVPSEILVDQWIDEARTELANLPLTLVKVGAGESRERWLPRLRDVLDSRLGMPPGLVVGTYDSAKTEPFLYQSQARDDQMLLICDEVHAVGAPESRKILEALSPIRRLGLSATPERFNDLEGTDAIFGFFGKKVDPVFGISEAIQAGRLVPYAYNIRTVRLSDDENEQYERISAEIRRISVIRDAAEGPNTYFEKLLRDRANIVKGAEAKVSFALDILKEKIGLYSHWLVYCNSLAQIGQLRALLEKQNISSLEYHSFLSRPARKDTLAYFTNNGGVLAAVHCLDQGVDIPRIDAAIILASSTNPREYIQRRGRILRAAPQKTFADLNDIVTLTSDGVVALRSDIERAREIGEHAQNRDRVLADIEFLEGTLPMGNNDSVEDDEHG